MEFRVLGPLEVMAESGPVVLGGTKQRTVLALLLLDANRVVSVDRLIDEIWGDEAPADPSATLQVYISNLRKLVDPHRPKGTDSRVLVSRKPGYMLQVGSEQLDLLRFEAMVSEARRQMAAGTLDHAASQLADALALWRGSPLADLAYERFAQRAIVRLEELRLAAVEDRVEADLALGRHRQLIGELESLVDNHPVRERLRGQLMLALYRSGRQTDALRAYRAARESLVEELGIDPSPELQRLEQAILAQDASLELASPAPLAGEGPPARSQSTLPLPVTTFVGREGDVADLGELVKDNRIVTLTGPGGCGKTRLALRVAWDLVASFPDGVRFVELSALTDPQLVFQAVADACGLLADRDGSLIELREHLREREMLVVFDGCEHVVEAAAALAHALVRACGGLHILATSRELLGVGGELVRTVPSLAEAEALQLFVARATSAVPSLVLNAETEKAAVEVCRRLDGMPLAIELAAVRLRVLTPRQLADGLDERFRLLTGGNRTALPRHQTLRATIDWSYDLLSEAERDALRSLSVFAGRWTLEAADAICGQDVDGFELVASLLDKSLVVVDQREPELRYRLLETIQHYARDRLRESGREAEVRKRHADWFLDLAERAEGGLAGAGRSRWLARLAEDHEDFRVALRWFLDNQSEEPALRLAGALSALWLRSGHLAEGRTWLDRALSTGSATSPVRAKAQASAAMLAFEQGDYGRTESLGTEARELFAALGDRRGLGSSLCLLATLARARGDYVEATALAEQALVVFETLEDRAGMAGASRELGMIARVTGDLEQARAHLDRGLRLFEELGVTEAALPPSGAVIDARQRSQVLSELGLLSEMEGDHRRATALLEESLGLSHGLGNKVGLAQCLEGLAEVAARQGRAERAAILFGAAEGLREEIGAVSPPREMRERKDLMAGVESDLGTAFADSRARGRSMSLTEAFAFATQPMAESS